MKIGEYGSSSFDGYIDEVRVSNIARPAEWIKASYNNQRGSGNYSTFGVEETLDTDNDGILNNGDGSGVIGDNFCTGGETTDCDDNCADTPNPNQEDMDSDGVGDACDNCRAVENPDQSDSNSEEDDNTALEGEQHYGDVCDPDFDNDGDAGISDFNEWRRYAGQDVPPAPEYIDLNNDGTIWIQDYNIWRSYYAQPPGPGIGD